MPRILPLLTVAGLSAGLTLSPTTHADLLVYEGWDYDAGSLSAGTGDNLNGGGGFDGAWSFSTGSNTQINAGSMTHAGVTTTGNQLQLRGQGDRDLEQTFGGPTQQDLWVSTFLLTNNNSRQGNLELDLAGTQTVVINNNAGNSANLTIGDSSEALTTGGSPIVPDTFSHFYLLKLEFGVQVDDGSGGLISGTRGFVWYDPDLSNGEAGLGAANATVEEDAVISFDGVTVQHNSPSSFISRNDEIRIATTFQDAISETTVVPEPASLALLAAGGLCLVGRRRR
jgi:hypothetical protein